MCIYGFVRYDSISCRSSKRSGEMIDRLVEKNRKLREEIERLKKEIDEYKKHHPSIVGVKNGKAYLIMEERPRRMGAPRTLKHSQDIGVISGKFQG